MRLLATKTRTAETRMGSQSCGREIMGVSSGGWRERKTRPAEQTSACPRSVKPHQGRAHTLGCCGLLGQVDQADPDPPRSARSSAPSEPTLTGVLRASAARFYCPKEMAPIGHRFRTLRLSRSENQGLTRFVRDTIPDPSRKCEQICAIEIRGLTQKRTDGGLGEARGRP